MAVLKNKDTGHMVQVPEGFSWTTLFFGVFVPLLRGDLKWATIMFLLSIFTCGLSMLIMPFIYNKIYMDNMIAKGYKVI